MEDLSPYVHLLRRTPHNEDELLPSQIRVQRLFSAKQSLPRTLRCLGIPGPRHWLLLSLPLRRQQKPNNIFPYLSHYRLLWLPDYPSHIPHQGPLSRRQLHHSVGTAIAWTTCLRVLSVPSLADLVDSYKRAFRFEERGEGDGYLVSER